VQLHLPEIQHQFAATNAQLFVVSFAPIEELRQWLPFFRKSFLERYFKEHKLDLPSAFFTRTRFLSDTGLQAYHAYGLGRFSPWRAYGPKIIRQYMRFIFQGKPLRIPNGDTLQKGGDFVVNHEGRITLSHIGTDQSERPIVSDILAALRL
jgi:hypothetical protein